MVFFQIQSTSASNYIPLTLVNLHLHVFYWFMCHSWRMPSCNWDLLELIRLIQWYRQLLCCTDDTLKKYTLHSVSGKECNITRKWHTKRTLVSQCCPTENSMLSGQWANNMYRSVSKGIRQNTTLTVIIIIFHMDVKLAKITRKQICNQKRQRQASEFGATESLLLCFTERHQISSPVSLTVDFYSLQSRVSDTVQGWRMWENKVSVPPPQQWWHI